MSLESGARLGPYEILEPLGAGGMGEVYRARDNRLNRSVAVKVSAEEFSERFEREAQAIAQLNHAHICQLYDVGPNYLVMEYVEGTPLAGPMPLEKVVEYASQILDAIDAAHRRGITHRDLKPANILLTKQGIKLLDFGLAKTLTGLVSNAAAATMSPLTGEGQIVGTMQYMSPEQLQGKEVDARSDLFSFGCVLYEMLTGTRAFDGENPASVIAAVLNREAPSVASVAPSLVRIVKRSLAKDPDQRFQTARDLKAALAWALDQPVPATEVRRSTRWHWVAAAAILVLGMLGGWAASHFGQPPPDQRVIRFQIQPPEGGRFVIGANIGGMALSPDGRTVAYVASVNGRNGLWIRSLDSTAARLLPGTDAAGGPFWSPDGRSIAFVASSTLYRIDLDGGNPLAICNAAVFRGGVWTTDGNILFGALSSGLLKVPATGGTAVPLTTLDASRGEGFHGFPQLLPDNRILYLARGDRPETTGVYSAPLSNPAERTLLQNTEANALFAPGGNGPGYLLWTRGGTLLAQAFEPGMLRLTGAPHPIADRVGAMGITGYMNATVSTNGLLLFSHADTLNQFVFLDRTGQTLGLVGEPGDYTTFRLSPNGRRIIASRERGGGSDLWLLEMDRGGVATRVTSRPAHSTYPIWAPDGQGVVFASDSPLNLFRRDWNEAQGERRLTRSPHQHLPMDWSQDGAWIMLYESSAETGRDLSLFSTAAGDAAPKPYVQTPFSEWWARFSPGANPQWVAYQSDESGRYEVYVYGFPTPRSRTQISTGGGQFPQWDASGRELFYLSPEFKLMSVSLKIGPDSIVPSAPRELFSIPAVDTGRNPYDTVDGQRFLVRSVPQQAAPPLTMIVNWPAELSK